MKEREAQFVAGSKRKKGYLYPPSKNVTVTVPGADYPGQVGADFPPPGLSGSKLGKNLPNNPPHILGANHQKIEGADYPAQIWTDNPAWKNQQHENGDNFGIRTPFLMILGSLESPQRALQLHPYKHHSITKEDKTK
jgi:hypothetical protein